MELFSFSIFHLFLLVGGQLPFLVSFSESLLFSE